MTPHLLIPFGSIQDRYHINCFFGTFQNSSCQMVMVVGVVNCDVGDGGCGGGYWMMVVAVDG